MVPTAVILLKYFVYIWAIDRSDHTCTLQGDKIMVRSHGDAKHLFGIVTDKSKCYSIFDPQGKEVHIVPNLFTPRGVILG